jgi:hypothetical protein
MKNSSLKIWSNFKSDEPAMGLLRQGARDHQLILSTEPNQADTSLETADIAFGQPDADVVRRSSTLRWVHLDSAGYV